VGDTASEELLGATEIRTLAFSEARARGKGGPGDDLGAGGAEFRARIHAIASVRVEAAILGACLRVPSARALVLAPLSSAQGRDARDARATGKAETSCVNLRVL
jgi:hypothetical protein